MSGDEIRQRAALKGQRGGRKGQEGWPVPPLRIGLAGALDKKQVLILIFSRAVKYKSVCLFQSHLITHAELRPYVCEYCDAGFTNGQSLRIHLLTHTQVSIALVKALFFSPKVLIFFLFLHNICFRGEIRKIFTRYPPLSRPMGKQSSG